MGRGLKYWLPYYIKQKLLPAERVNIDRPVHLFVCVADHFEPFNGGVGYNTALSRMDAWVKRYPAFADQHKDSDGTPLQHTWFYPPHLDHAMLPYLVDLCLAGYGNIEMHLHHNHMEPFPDTSETLKCKILKCIDDYGKYGIFTQPEGDRRFAFIHGDWSLDNSGGKDLCGVNDELTILRECGCYADFTFPCLNESQPAMVNKIYYAKDDPQSPKSYNFGRRIKVGRPQDNDELMMIQGVLGLRYDAQKRHKFAVEYSDLSHGCNITINRVNYWLKNSLCLEGSPNFRFVKLHTHGAPEYNWEANWGGETHNSLSYLQHYCDKNNIRLHYVTARQMFNVIKSIECRVDYSIDSLDFIIKPYSYKL